MSEKRPTLPKPPSLIASRTQTISSVSFEEAPATPPTRGEPNKAFATPAHRKVPETPLGPTPPKPSKEASDHLDVKTPPRLKAKNVTPSPDCPQPPNLRRGNSIRSSSVARLPEGRVCLVVGGNAVARRVVELLARELDTAVVLTTSGGESVLDASEVIGVQGFDLGLLAEMRRLAKDIRSRFGRLDVLVNCGACERLATETTGEGLDRRLVVAHLAPHLLARELAPLLERTAGRCIHACVDDRASKDDVRASVLQPLDARGLADFALEHASAVSVVVSLETRSKKGWGLCRGPPESAEERAAELVCLLRRNQISRRFPGSMA